MFELQELAKDTVDIIRELVFILWVNTEKKLQMNKKKIFKII